MSIRTLAARGLSFAHLAGIKPRGARAEDDRQEDDERAEEQDQEEQDRDDGDAKGSKGKKGKRAEDRTDDPDAEDEENDEVENDSGKGKKGKRAEDDEADEGDDDSDPDAEDDDDEMRGKSAVARARRREQARCAAIMGSKYAARNVEMAANLAFKTRMTRQEALAVLRSAPSGAATPQSQRRADRNPQLGAGGEMQRNPQREASAGWDRAFTKATGKRA
ncbi:hypothetical protein PPMP20_04430 [Paraburkholderia phymatum]|uniref:Uncharacterized protein n=1 Tax=Paraburkholderia phymatum (strain DSM 17167 / CIP 108236 / LMG 21445 / STM815) TaxID=391038 RepID=B2JD07_PARP8|nr:hypothetical protein [Paraburkholderia phymatum]ACC71063.1 conserved hypothetical protein [Paraburkholderia phymatum STM815]